MRVLYFTERDSPHDRRFLRSLAGTQHQVYVLRQWPCESETPDGVAALHWPDGIPDWSHWGGWLRAKVQFVDLVAAIQPDVLHAGPVQGPAFLTALAGFHPLVTMSWGSDLLRQAKRSPWMQFATCCTLEHTDILLVDCQTVANEAALYGFPPQKVVRFPWGVDLEFFSSENGRVAGQALRQSLGWDEKFIILCNRTWSPLYGVDLLAKAFVEAAKENRDLCLLLVGEGPQADSIRRILTPVADRVHLPGWLKRNMLPGVYFAADLFVSPSHSDGSSISLLEALACGCPALVSDIPSNQEWVFPHENGELFRDGDVHSLKEKILAMAVAQGLGEFGKQSRLIAEARADWSKNFQKLLDAYQFANGKNI